jgi:hypothetical protein
MLTLSSCKKKNREYYQNALWRNCFWDVMPCNVVDICWCSRGTCCLQSIWIPVTAVKTSGLALKKSSYKNEFHKTANKRLRKWWNWHYLITVCSISLVKLQRLIINFHQPFKTDFCPPHVPIMVILVNQWNWNYCSWYQTKIYFL